MGVKGPIPERSDQRVRRNKDDVPISKITSISPVVIKDLGISNAHPLVVDLYESMKTSAQSTYYQDSDWSYARLTLYVLNDMLVNDQLGAMKLAAVNTMLTSLLLTEGDRRRVRIEVEKAQAEGVVIDVAEMFRQQLQKRS